MSISSDLKLVEFGAQQAKPSSQEVVIAITSDGLRFSSGFVRAFNLGKRKGVVLYADPSKKVVAFKFHDQVNLKAHPEMRGLKLRNGGFVIRARAFFVHFGLDIKRHLGRYTPNKHREDSLGEVFIIRIGGQAKAMKRAMPARRVASRGTTKRRSTVRKPTRAASAIPAAPVTAPSADRRQEQRV